MPTAIRDRAGQAYTVTGRGDISSRIRHLEDIILSLRDQNFESQSQVTALSGSLPITSGSDGGQRSSAVSQDLATRNENTPSSPGMMLTNNMGTRWVDATHWEAILDDVGVQGV